MSLPKKDFRGQQATISMMEFRKQPGEVIDRVSNGMTITIEKNGKTVGILSPTLLGSETIVNPDGSISGEIPLTFRRNLGEGKY